VIGGVWCAWLNFRRQAPNRFLKTIRIRSDDRLDSASHKWADLAGEHDDNQHPAGSVRRTKSQKELRS
jgi:hypothetical protein